MELAASGIPGTVVLECLAERTIVAGRVAPAAPGGGLFATPRAGMHWQKAAIRVLPDLELEDERGRDVATD